MGSVPIAGRMVKISMRDILRMEWDMEKGNGLLEKQSIQETMQRAWSKDMGSYIYQVETFIREIS